MPATAAPKSPDAKIAAARAAMIAEAEETWRGFVEILADGGSPPDPRALLEISALLGLYEPSATLAGDVKTLLQVRDLETRAAAERAQVDAALQPFGGEAGALERLAALRAEVAELERLTGPWMHHGAALSAGQASRLRRANPRIFPAVQSKPSKSSRRSPS